MASSTILASSGGIISDIKHLVDVQIESNLECASSTSSVSGTGSNGKGNRNHHQNEPHITTTTHRLDDKESDLALDAASNPQTDHATKPQQLATSKSIASHRNLHTHRQNHNSSKLPAFRFADLKQHAISQKEQAQNQKIPSSPISAAHSSTPNPVGSTINEHEPGPEQHQHQESKQHHLQKHSSAGYPGSGAEPVTEANSTTDNTKAIPPITTGAESQKLVSTKPTSTAPGSDKISESIVVPTSAVNNNNKILDNTTRTQPSTLEAASTASTPSATTSKPIKTVAHRRPASLPADSSSIKSRPERIQQQHSTNTPPSSISASTARHARHRYSDPSSEIAAITSPRGRQNNQEADQTVETGTSPKDWEHRQRDLLIVRPFNDDLADDKQKFKSRPPLSFRPLRSEGPGIRVPPIRSFRSSGSRKSWAPDMTALPLRSPLDEGNYGEESTDPNHRDRTLWALEGRAITDPQMTPPDSAVAAPDADNTADLFMKIATEDAPRAPHDGDRPLQDPSVVSRVARSFHRRPLSTVIPPTHTPISPPQITRRLSDQRETSHFQRTPSEHSRQQTTRDWAQRAVGGRERSVQIDDRPRSRVLGAPPSLKSSPVTPRSPPSQDTPDGFFSHSRRRTSITDSSILLNRTASLKNSVLGNSRTYNSSPLVPKQPEPQAPDVMHAPAAEGTESSASTAAPSTVWDELDDIRSRIHRLELTGKTPATSGHAMSRASDDRPRTATTNATTLSGSPKRPGVHLTADGGSSTASSQREAQPILLSAVSKARPYLNSDAFGALESAASEVLTLSQMLGSSGQPGPISSGASTIGGGLNVTDRQLRRKADSICRSLTEMCLSLADDGAQRKHSTEPETPLDIETLTTSPTRFLSKPSTGHRRPVAASEVGLSRINTAISPRALARSEDRRATFLGPVSLSSPRFATAPGTEPSTPVTGRRSSLLISRTRRAGTEEPEDSSGGRKASLLTRTRRAGTEEPEEGRKTSFLLRNQRATYVEDDEDDSPRTRAPSRAATELGAFRSGHRDYLGKQQQQQQAVAANSDSSSFLNVSQPRRRLVSSSLNSRLMTPSTAPSAVTGRRYLDRSTPERDTTTAVTDRLAEDRSQRQFALGQTVGLSRASSLSKRRDSGIPSFLGSGAASHVGAYR